MLADMSKTAAKAANSAELDQILVYIACSGLSVRILTVKKVLINYVPKAKKRNCIDSTCTSKDPDESADLVMAFYTILTTFSKCGRVTETDLI